MYLFGGIYRDYLLKKVKKQSARFFIKIFRANFIFSLFMTSIIMVIIIVNIIVTFKVVRYLKVPKFSLLILNGSAI